MLKVMSTFVKLNFSVENIHWSPSEGWFVMPQCKRESFPSLLAMQVHSTVCHGSGTGLLMNLVASVKNKNNKDPAVFLLSLQRQSPLRIIKYLIDCCVWPEHFFSRGALMTLPPTVTLWYREVFHVLPQERIIAVSFLKLWKPVCRDP